MNEEIYKNIPTTYPLCLHDDCPKAHLSSPTGIPPTCRTGTLSEIAQPHAVSQAGELSALCRQQACDICQRVHQLPEKDVPRPVCQVHEHTDLPLRTQSLFHAPSGRYPSSAQRAGDYQESP